MTILIAFICGFCFALLIIWILAKLSVSLQIEKEQKKDYEITDEDKY